MRRLPTVGLIVSTVLLAGLAPAARASTTSDPLVDSSRAAARTGDSGVEDPYYPAKSNPEIDTIHDDLVLDWDGTSLSGVATVKFAATVDTDTIRLDLIHSLTVSDVSLDGSPIDYAHKGFGLVMQTGPLSKGDVHQLQITYAGKPHTVKAPTHRGDFAEGLGWTLDADGNVYTFQEPYGAYSWYPVNDHPSDKATFAAHVTVPDGDAAVFNGTLRPRHGNTWNWRLTTPTAAYLTTIAIGPYTAYHDMMSDGTKATYWLLPRDASIINSLKAQSDEAFDWLTKHAGPYPFSTWATVVTGGDSAMETETIVTLSRSAFDRPDAVIEHEMAHQWYGDAITPRNWQGLWLSEGWAMWMQQAYEVYRGGYRYLGGLDNWRSYDDESRQRSGPPGDYDPKSFGDLNVYLGPAMMLDKIRQRIGDKAFITLSKDWVTDHEYGNVTRAQFITWVDDTTGRKFDKLINLWLDSPHTPEWP